MQDLEAVDAALAELYRECGLEKVWSVLLELNARNNDVYAKLRGFTLEVSEVLNDYEKVKRKLESKGLHLSAKRGSEEQLIAAYRKRKFVSTRNNGICKNTSRDF